jgi:2-haloacid dehalogenase
VTSVVVFDVNETLSDMSPMADRFAEVGAPRELAALWFASVLRDGFALAAAGAAERFSVLAESALGALLPVGRVDRGPDGAIAHVMAGFGALAVHSDVPGGVRGIRAAGHRLVTMSNGASAVAEGLLTRARVRSCFERCLSVEDAGVWKPDRRAYHYAVRECGVAPGEALMVAVHPWDIDGAARAGLATAWIDRGAGQYPAHLTPPDLLASGVDDLARRLGVPSPSPGPDPA